MKLDEAVGVGGSRDQRNGCGGKTMGPAVHKEGMGWGLIT